MRFVIQCVHPVPAKIRARRRRGLSIVEVLISLSITAMLLTAVTAAFSASASIVENNDEFFRASQAARVSMTQILTEIRRSHAVSVTGSQIDMIASDGTDRSYAYDNTAQRLKLVTNDVTTDPDYTLASNVTSAAFAADTKTDQGGISHVVRVSVTLVIHVGGNEIRLSGSAAPRRVQSYE